MDTSQDFETPECARSPVKFVESLPQPTTPEPSDQDASQSKTAKKESQKAKSPKASSPSKRTRSGLMRPPTPQKKLSPTRFASRPTSPKAELTPTKLSKSMSQPSSPKGTISPSKRTSRTPGHSPKKLSRSSSRTSSTSTVSPNKRSPRSLTPQPGPSPAKHAKTFFSLPATPIPSTSPAKTPEYEPLASSSTASTFPADPSTDPEVLPEQIPEEVPEPQPDPAIAEIVPNEETIIEINMGDKVLGIDILGGCDTLIKGPAAVILEVYKEGAAAADGRLKVGDQIRECNGIVIHENMVNQRIRLSIKLKVEKMTMTVYRPDPLQFEEVEVELKKKSGKSFGLSCTTLLQGPGVYIKELLEDSPAEKDGNLQKGDFLLKVDDKDVSNLTLLDVATILKLCDKRMTLRVKRFKIIPWEIPCEKMEKKLRI